MQDAAQILKIMTEINAIPLALQITSIAGKLFQEAVNSRILIYFFTRKCDVQNLDGWTF